MSLPDSTKATIKATIPVLRSRGVEVVQAFYQNLFQAYPSVKRQFNTDRQSAKDGTPAQVSALANAVLLYARRIDDVGRLAPLLRPIAEKHVSRGVSARQYDAVGECLLGAMKQVLGEVASEEVLRAWGEAYGVLKEVFVGLENEIRLENEMKAGWSGMREVRVAGVAQGEGERVLRLEVELRECAQGMFVSVVVMVGEEESMTSVKIVEVHEDGISVAVEENWERVTRELMNVCEGDTVSISVPCGVPK